MDVLRTERPVRLDEHARERVVTCKVGEAPGQDRIERTGAGENR